MKAEQISVFLENKAGRIAEVTAILFKADVNIRALSLADTSDFGVLRLIVNNNKIAEDALKKEGFTIRKTDVVAVEVPDKPGGLNNILSLLQNAKLNVEYMYTFVKHSGSNAIMIFKFDQTDAAIKLLTENNISMISSSKLYIL